MRKYLLFSLSVLLSAFAYSQTANFLKNKPSIASILNPDGSLNLNSANQGEFDTRGYRMGHTGSGAPVFFRGNSITVAGDENWDPDFSQPGVNGVVYSICIDGGDAYVGGTFSKAGGITANHIAKYDGSAWYPLGAGLGGTFEAVWAIKKFGTSVYATSTTTVGKWDGNTWTIIGTVSGQIQSNLLVVGLDVDASGNLYAVGSFQYINGVLVNGVAKWNGTVWSPLGSGVNPATSPGPTVVAVSGSNVYVGGGISSIGGITVSSIAMWNGSVWSNVGGGVSGTGAVTSLCVKGTDLYVGGNFTLAGSTPVNNIAKWNGSAWSALGSGTNGLVMSIVTLGSDIYAAGSFSQAGGNAANKVSKWNGSVWSNASNGLVMLDVEAMGISAERFMVGGSTDINAKLDMHNIAKWNGSSWVVTGNGIGSSITDLVNCMTIDGNNLYVGGGFIEAGGLKVNRIAKWNGVKWDSLGPGFSFGEVRDIVVLGGQVYAGGTFQSGPGPNYLAVWNGSTWSSLPNAPNYHVFALATFGSDLYVGGHFDHCGPLAVNSIAKWNGSTWNNMAGGIIGDVKDIKIASDGTLYAGGDFILTATAVCNRIAKWNGTVWSAMNMGVNNYVNAIGITSSDEIYIGGVFDVPLGGPIVYKLAKWSGTNWVQVGGGLPAIGAVFSIATRGTEVFVGGQFVTAGGTTVNNIAKWDGANWNALGSGVLADPTGLPFPMGMAVNCNNLYAGGYFAIAGGKRSDRFGRYAIDGLPSVTISTATNTICAGTNTTFTAAPVNTGQSPGYQWQVNGVNVGTNSTTYSTTSLTNNAQVRMIMSGNGGCINPYSVTSNTITMTVNPVLVPSISIAGTTTVNQGSSTLLTATPVNGGAGPVYGWADSTAAHTWQIIPGATSITHNYTPAATGVKIRCGLVSNATCATPTTVISNALTFTVNPVTAIDPVAAANFGIRYYPNPVREKLFIDSLKLSDRWQSVDIVSMEGRKIIPTVTISNHFSVVINIAFLPAGQYTAVLRRTKGPAAYLKFIKE